MAAKFIDINDFIGKYSIDQTYFDSDIVEETERNILIDLLGLEYYNDLLDDLDENDDPQTALWIAFVNGTEYTDVYQIKYYGIVNMLVAFSYYEILNSKEFSTSTGFIAPQNENSRVKSTTELKQIAYQRYNEGVNYYVQCEQWIQYNIASFPNWEHKTKSYKQLIRY